MRKKIRKELAWGLMFYGVSITLNQFFDVPEMIMGVCMGLTICLEIIGILSDASYERLKAWKRSLWHKTRN